MRAVLRRSPVFVLAATVLLTLPVRAQGAFTVRACVEDEEGATRLPGTQVRLWQQSRLVAQGTTAADGCVQLSGTVATGSAQAPGATAGFAAGAAFPNPAARVAYVPLSLGQAQAVAWSLYDPAGRLVAGPVAAALPPGVHRLPISLDALPAGAYVYRVTAGTEAATGVVVRSAGAGVESGGGTPALQRVAAAVVLAFEAAQAGYATLRAEQSVENGATVVLRLARQRGPGRPLPDMAAGTAYLGFEGGLYPGGINTPPAAHHSAGVARGQAVVPRNTAGAPAPGGRYVLLSIGMSNTTQEFCGEGTSGGPPCQSWSFAGQALADAAVNRTTLAIVDGARGGQVAEVWASPSSAEYTRIRDQVLAPKGLSEAQVQVVWVKVARRNPTVSLPAAGADAYALVTEQGAILRALRQRYPNLRQVFFSSRLWAGFATTTLNPEPYAYESGFAVKWTVGAQIAQMAGAGVDARAGDLAYDTAAPWAAWGPYLWAEGLRPRADGLVWRPTDFQGDGTHPARDGEQKVGTLLLNFFKTSPYTRCWFLVSGTCGP